MKILRINWLTTQSSVPNPRLVSEARPRLRVVHQLGRQALDSNGAVELGIVG